MTKTNKVSLLLSLALLSNAAFATPYVSGQVGYLGASQNNPVSNVFNADFSTFTGRVAAGYLWDFAPRFSAGLETGVMMSMLDVLAVADLYVTEKVDIFAKAGAEYIQHSCGDHFFPKAALGVGYDVAENVNVNLSVDHTFLNDRDFGKSTVLAGVKFSFG